MSTINASTFAAGNAKLTSTGMKLPSFSEASRPSGVETGTLILNSDNGKVQVWNGSSWVTVGGGLADGNSAETAFANLSDLPSGQSGIQKLYTTLGGAVGPFRVAVNFDVSGGPWYMTSFIMPDSVAWITDDVNATVGKGVYNNNNNTQSSTTRPARTGNMPYRGSSTRIGEVYTPNYINNVSNANNRGWYTGGAGYNTGWLNISYYNHGEEQAYTQAQLTALRNICTQMAPQTPHTAMEVDAQGLGSNTNWRSDYTGNIGGHANWIRDYNNNVIRSTPSEQASDERGACWFWRPGFYQASLFGGGSFSYTPSGSNSPNINNGLDVSFIFPKDVKFSGTTGGGSAFGTAYHVDGGFNNRYNSRNYFLTK